MLLHLSLSAAKSNTRDGVQIYRRARRSFGRQRVNVTRLRFRIGVLTVVAALLLLGPHGNLHLVEAVLAGIVAEASLPYFRQFLAREALRHARPAAASPSDTVAQDN